MGRRVLACLLVVLMLSALLPQQASGATLLRRGSRGAAVQQLQQQLIKLGFLQGSADGIFGPQTEAAVRSFQKAYGLKQDGIAGSATLGKLVEVLSGSTGSSGSSSAPAPEPPSRSESSSAPITTTLRLGSRGSQVVTLQRRLNELGYNCGAADGVFGSRTRQAVMVFQRDNGLAVDGIVGPKTIAKLFAVNNPPQNQNPEPSAPPSNDKQTSGGSENGNQNATPPITTTLRLGSRGSQVVTLQRRLNELGYNCGAADGVFGSRTRQAVMAFQRDNGLAVDGIVGPKTIAKLFPVQPPQNPQPQLQPQPQPEPKPEPKPEPEPQPQPQPEPQPEPGFTQFHGTPGALTGKVIFVDAGHGGTDPGATKEHQGYGLVKEKDMVLDMALRLKRILEEAGATVILTRSDDRYYSLFYRSALVNTHILQTELAAVKKDRDAAVEAKQVKEEQISKLEFAKANLPQYEVRLNELQGKLELIEKYEEYLQKEQQVSDVAKQLEDLTAQRDALMQEYQAIVIDTSKLNGDVQSLNAALTALEVEQEKKAALLEQFNKVKVDLEAVNTALNENDVAKATQAAEKFGQDIGDLANMVNDLEIDEAVKEPVIGPINQIINEDLPQVKELLARKKSLEEQLAQVDAQISDLEEQLAQLQQDVEKLAEELGLPESQADLDKALAEEDKINADLEGVKQSIDKMKADIANLVDIEKGIGEIISQIEDKLPVLEQEKKALEEEIAAKEEQISILSTRIQQFKVYLDNPGMTDRVDIYAEQMVNGKRYATPDLVEVFDLTRQKYQDNYLFISLHCNSTPGDGDQTSASGISVFYRDNGPYAYNGTYGVNVEYYKGYNAAERERFAKVLLQQLNATTNFSKKYTVPYKADFSVLRENNVISVLVEVGFINNPNDRALLIKEQTREDVAAGIYKGIVEYYKR
ncbi:peptidoglycan-binding protein [Caldicoprobacter algeriensis]|uniref:peptidoglycan-binding protein n=1 Tax=Caldicoprobacter algeriensis TaxID=699281 RepID=UPI0023EF00B9|nr:peptidoglycan-binding protein [Caldicoprobacter algeriensis]MCM8899788.1 peptidoglycan-binding protein [Caldicoprobacter algeriensis]